MHAAAITRAATGDRGSLTLVHTSAGSRGGSSSTPPSTRSLSGLPAKGRGVGDGPIALAGQRRLPHPRRPGAPAGPHRHEGRCVSWEESFVAVGSTQGPSSSPGWVTVIQDSSELSPCSHHQVNHILCYCLLTILRVKQGQGGATRSSAVHHPLIPHPQAPDSTKELKTDKEGGHGHPWRRHKAAQRKFEVSQSRNQITVNRRPSSGGILRGGPQTMKQQRELESWA